MGYPYHELISPAILLDNPGLTRDQFSCQLENIRRSSKSSVSVNSWGGYIPLREDDELPERLGLQYSQKFIDFQNPSKDSNGYLIYPPRLEKYNSENTGYKYQVIKHTQNNFGSSETIKRNLEQDVEEGEITDLETENSYNQTEYFIDEVILKKTLQKINLNSEENVSGYEYTLKVREYNPICEIDSFDCKEELFQKWPQFKPENMFDFSQSKGHFAVRYFEKGKFLWKNINGRYYLDKETFNNISHGFSYNRNYGYVDLILTAEAIKHQAWKLLSHRGLDYLSDFINDFPDSRARYEKAIWDSYTSSFAKSREMNHFEMIKMRLPPHQINQNNP